MIQSLYFEKARHSQFKLSKISVLIYIARAGRIMGDYTPYPIYPAGIFMR